MHMLLMQVPAAFLVLVRVLDSPLTTKDLGI